MSAALDLDAVHVFYIEHQFSAPAAGVAPVRLRGAGNRGRDRDG